MERANIRYLPTTMGFIAFLVISISGRAAAQCRPGDLLVGETEQAWLCEHVASEAEVVEVVSKYRPAMLGKQWQLRKKVIDGAGCLRRVGVQYGYGNKMDIPADCSISKRNEKIDCSGLTQAASQFAACVVNGITRALTAFDPFGSEPRSAADQARILKSHGAFRGPDYNGLPGDLVFFEGTAKKRSGITHVGVYLGTNATGIPYIIHASSAAGKVAIGQMSDFLRERIAGYGDLSSYYESVTGK